jgi:predicted RNA-binding Zn ribbon-like protein
VTDAALVTLLANARADRRPAHAPAAVPHDALAHAASAAELLGPFVAGGLQARDLATLRAVQRELVAIVDALIEGSHPPLEALNALAGAEPAVYELQLGADGHLRGKLRPRGLSATAPLLAGVMRQLAELDPSRLRRCARPECNLVFYDTTRSRTQRWHAERPCGLRDRQRRHRARQRLG